MGLMFEMNGTVQVFPLRGIPRVKPGDDLLGYITRSLEAGGIVLQDSDVVVVTQKVVSKAEGRVV